jgi:hypothetical protein
MPFEEDDLMRTNVFLSTVAAAALALGCVAASAQTTEKGSGGAPSGAMEKSAPSGAMENSAPGEARTPQHGSGTVEKSKPGPMNGPRAQGASPSDSREGKPENKAAQGGATTQPGAGNSRMSSDGKPGADKAANDRSAQRGGEANQGRNGAQTTVGAAPSSETKLTGEQRTQIREKVIATGPKLTNVNFALNVGTVVPRDVRVVEVPTIIIDLHPEWRGYRYFVVNDRVVIVEPDSLRIIAILDV